MKLRLGLLLLRIAAGTPMMLHGLMKLTSGPTFWENLGGLPPMIPDIGWLKLTLGLIAALIEFAGGILVIAGYGVRCASIAIVLVMLIAFTYHIPNINSFNALMYNTWPLEIGLVFAAIAVINPGRKLSPGESN